MLSYRHAFHAGNHADVLKHAVLVALLRYLNEKPKPYAYVDTHAGAGGYALAHGYAAKNAEYAGGVERLLAWAEANPLPPLLADYVDQVRAFNRGAALSHYPGSPGIARQLLRPHDRLWLFELHGSDARLLEKAFADDAARCQIRRTDGFAGLKAVLPPSQRRGLTLIDPSYEDKRDYGRVVTALKEAQARFPTGCYAIWYPLLQRVEAHRLPGEVKRLGGQHWLHVSLRVNAPKADGFGMHGSGMLVLNPPWTLPQALHDSMPALVKALGVDDTAAYQLEFEIA